MRDATKFVELGSKGRPARRGGWDAGTLRAARRGACALVAVVAASCACPAKSGADQRHGGTAPPASSRSSESRSDSSHHAGLSRPDLSADWNWDGQALPTGDVTTSVIKIESMSPAKVNPNTEYEYKIRVTNISPTMQLTDVAVTERLPAAGYAFVSANPAGEKSGDQMMTWNLGQLAPGDVREIAVRGRATSVGAVKGCASVAYTPIICIESAVVAPALELTRIAPGDVTQVDEIPIQIVVRNPGTGDAHNVKVAEQLPEGWTVNGERLLAYDVGTLKAGEKREFNVKARASKTGQSVGKATATADGGLVVESSSTKTAVGKPVLDIKVETSAETQYLGRDTVYTITVKNTGDCAARDFVLEGVTNGAERIVSVSDGGVVTASNASDSGAKINWRLGTLAAGASRAVKVTANRTTDGLVASAATASAYGATAVTANAKTPYLGVPALLVEVVDDQDPVVVGASSNYTITVTNQGTAPDTDIVVTCTLEDYVTFVEGNGATKSSMKAGVVTFEPLKSLAPKQTAVWKLTVRGAKAGDSRLKVDVNTKETGRPISESEATRIYD